VDERPRGERIDEERYSRAVGDVWDTWTDDRWAMCVACFDDDFVNADGRCFHCAVQFLAKVRSIGIIAEPWGLKQARSDGIAKY
jgi:hypothetical protein